MADGSQGTTLILRMVLRDALGHPGYGTWPAGSYKGLCTVLGDLGQRGESHTKGVVQDMPDGAGAPTSPHPVGHVCYSAGVGHLDHITYSGASPI